MLPLVVQIENTEQHVAETVAFNRSPVRLGRNPLNDLQLEEGFVSQWHAVVRFSETRTTVLDLGSTNRTTVDGVPVERNVEVEVNENSDVRIGSLRLHLLRVEAPADLYARRSKSAFARVGNPEQGDVMRTMYFGDAMPGGGQDVAEIAALSALVRGTPAGGSNASASGRPAPLAAPAVAATSGRPAVTPSGRPMPAPSSRPMPAAVAHAPLPPSSSDAVSEAYRAYRSSWNGLFAAVRTRLQTVGPQQREVELLNLQRQYPQLALEPDFRAHLRELGIDPLKAGQPEMEDWLRRLTGGLFPPPGASINIALAMERVGEILEVFSSAFVELRRSHDQFCREMSLSAYAEESSLPATDNPRELLAHLLNPAQAGAQTPIDLGRALADFAVHQVALVSAVVEGARSMLEVVSPKMLSRASDPPRSLAVPDESVMDALWPHAKRKLWRRFVAAHHDLAEGDRFTRELFGRRFARRYYSVTGGGNTGEQG
jgi:predicted component of type VI protein secretion system